MFFHVFCWPTCFISWKAILLFELDEHDLEFQINTYFLNIVQCSYAELVPVSGSSKTVYQKYIKVRAKNVPALNRLYIFTLFI